MMFRLLRYLCLMMFPIWVTVAHGDDCVPLNYTITYTCGNGTVASGKSLPSPLPVQYNTNVTHRSFNASVCNAPSGQVFAGYWILPADGQTTDVYVTDLTDFTYYYTSDMTVAMRFIPLVPDANTVWAHVLDDDKSANKSGNWSSSLSVDFYYGRIEAEVKCSSSKPANSTAGFQYSGTPGTGLSNRYCYCHVTSPASSSSPWVFVTDMGLLLGGISCSSSCANKCNAALVENLDFRLSMFSGFMP